MFLFFSQSSRVPLPPARCGSRDVLLLKRLGGSTASWDNSSLTSLRRCLLNSLTNDFERLHFHLRFSYFPHSKSLCVRSKPLASWVAHQYARQTSVELWSKGKNTLFWLKKQNPGNFISSHCLTQKSVITCLELDVCTYIQFLAAKSLWTNFLLARYFIPFATWRPNPIKSFTVGFCKIQTFVMKQWMQKPKEQTVFLLWLSVFDTPILPPEWSRQVGACSKTGVKFRSSSYLQWGNTL